MSARLATSLTYSALSKAQSVRALLPGGFDRLYLAQSSYAVAGLGARSCRADGEHLKTVSSSGQILLSPTPLSRDSQPRTHSQCEAPEPVLAKREENESFLSLQAQQEERKCWCQLLSLHTVVLRLRHSSRAWDSGLDLIPPETVSTHITHHPGHALTTRSRCSSGVEHSQPPLLTLCHCPTATGSSRETLLQHETAQGCPPSLPGFNPADSCPLSPVQQILNSVSATYPSFNRTDGQHSPPHNSLWTDG